MLAGLYSGIGKIECREVPEPSIGENDLVVKVKAAAICGTALRIVKSGHFAIEQGQGVDNEAFEYALSGKGLKAVFEF